MFGLFAGPVFNYSILYRPWCRTPSLPTNHLTNTDKTTSTKNDIKLLPCMKTTIYA